MDGERAQTQATRRVAIVMAGTKGLGRASAEALAGGGYDLLICSRDESAVQEAAQQISKLGGRVEGMKSDVARPDELDALFERCDRDFGRLDALVANAGGPPAGNFLAVTDEQWEFAFHLTLMSTVRAMRHAVQRMQPNRFGRIVVIGSSSVRQPVDGLVLSNAFRPALDGVIKTLAKEIAADGITVNMACPGRLDTERVRALDEGRARNQGLTPEQVRQNTEKTIPAGRYGEPADLGALVGFLCSEGAGYITGQAILVDGGMINALP